MSPDSPSAAARRVSRPRPTRPTAEQQRRRDAALAQERAEWDRTRGAGAGVLRLLEEPSWRRAHAGKPPEQWSAPDVLPSITRIEAAPASEIREVPSADRLLATGIGDYTLLPKILGRGKFSTVFLASKQGKLYALKHTPLFPHHMLIATRLLREPTLLAELPPHPNLVAVHETIRTPGHFYLIEEYLGGYVTLERLLLLKSTVPPPSLPVLPTDVAGTVFSQLISAVEAIQHPLQICHRDIKPENILVHPVSLQLKLLDFGLATHYSKSQAKLSTCCGSPAYHCPEIVHALSSPLGTATYWGPEVDAWTVGVTMLRVLTGVRYPLGSSHNSLRSMAVRAQRAVALVQDPDLRRRTGMLLDMDAIQRMRNFELLARDAATDPDRTPKEFKSSTFVPTPPTHLIKLPLLVDKQGEPLVSRAHSRPREVASLSPSPAQAPPTPAPANPVSGGQALLTLLNPSHEPGDKVLSFIKYALRCFGILYHAWAVEEEWVLECVWEVPPVPETGGGTSFVHSIMSALGRKEKRSSSALVAGGEAPRPSPGPSGREGKIPCLRFYLIVRSLRSRRSPSMYRHASLGRTASRPGDNEVSEPGRTQSRPPARKRIHVLLTDGRALAAVAHALSLGGTQTVEEEEEERGRRPHPRRSSLAPTTSTVSEERGRRHFSRHASLAPSEATSRARAGRGRTRDQMDDWEREIGNAVQDLNLCLRGKDGGGGLSHLAASLMRWETQGVHSLALSGLQVLSVFSRHAPPREVFVALLERFDTLGTDCVQPHWNPLKEVIALLDLLIIVMPRLESKQPHKFTDELARALPRVVNSHASFALLHPLARLCCTLQTWTEEMLHSAEDAQAEAGRLYVSLLAQLARLFPSLENLDAPQDPNHPNASSRDGVPDGPVSDGSQGVTNVVANGVANGVTNGSTHASAGQQMLLSLSSPEDYPWEAMGQTLGHLDVSLWKMVQSSSPEAFVLLVHLLARQIKVGIVPPRVWSVEEAGAYLRGACRVFETGKRNGEGRLWIQWCLAAQPQKGEVRAAAQSLLIHNRELLPPLFLYLGEEAPRLLCEWVQRDVSVWAAAAEWVRAGFIQQLDGLLPLADGVEAAIPFLLATAPDCPRAKEAPLRSTSDGLAQRLGGLEI